MKIYIKNKKDAFEIESKWLGVFELEAKKKTNRFKWERLPNRHRNLTTGGKALELYKSQKSEDYYMFNEELSEAWECIDEAFPTDTPGNGDWYIFPKSEAWTMVFDHEQIFFFVKGDKYI